MTSFLLDTCAILWLGNGDKISASALEALDRAFAENTPVYVSPFSAWEIGNLTAKNRIRLPQSPDKWFDAFITKGRMALTSSTPDILVASCFLPEPLHKDPADQILIATARAKGLTIITRDQKILDYAKQGHVNALRC